MSHDQTYPPLLGNIQQHLFVHGENPADFYAYLKSLVEGFSPASTHEQSLVEDAAVARWYLWRRERASNATEVYLYAKELDPVRWVPADQRDLFIAQRLQQAAERSFRRAYANLEALRKESIRTERWELTHDLQKQRLSLAQRKYDDIAPKVQAQAELAALRAKKSTGAELRAERRNASNGHKRPSVVQKVKVRVVNGVTTTIRKPSNHDVLAELAERALHIYPPEQIVREFDFEHAIPREYDWAAEDGERGPAEVIHTIDVAEFRKIAAAEKEHCLGHPPERP